MNHRSLTPRLLLLIALALFLALPGVCSAQKWEISEHGVKYAAQGYDTLAAAIQAYPDSFPAGLAGKNIDLTALLNADDAFQAELLATLQSDSPKLLKKALASSGNIHNPAVDQLSAPLAAALMKTKIVREANAELAQAGLGIVAPASFEEFNIDKTGKTPRFRGGTWLEIKPLPAPGAEGKK